MANLINPVTLPDEAEVLEKVKGSLLNDSVEVSITDGSFIYVLPSWLKRRIFRAIDTEDVIGSRFDDSKNGKV